MFIHIYGLLIGIGIYLGILLAEKTKTFLATSNANYKLVNLDQLLWWIFIPTLIGARLYHVIDLWLYYQSDPVKILYVWQGGLAIYGALAGGLLGLLLYLYSKKQIGKILYYTDIIVIIVLIGQIIGRFGNYFNHELFGLPTKLPWGVYVPPQFRPAEFINNNYFHPLFFYESLLNLFLLCCIVYAIGWIYTLLGSILPSHFYYKICKPKTGIITGMYCFGYGLIRFYLDFLRIDPWRLGMLTTAQWLSLVVILFGLGLLLRRQ